jgi:hypothetical protein
VGSLPPDAELYKNPLQLGYLIQDLIDKAAAAEKRGDHAAEARYFRALTKVAPNEAFAPRKACTAYEEAGDLPDAVLACRTVLGRPGTNVDDSLHFINLVLSTKGPLPAAERTELYAVIKHLEHETQLGALPSVLRCDVALRFNDVPALEACSKELAAKAPKDPKTISFEWALALEKRDRGSALQLIDRARAVGMSGDGIARMERATRAMTLRRIGMLFVLIVAAGAAAFTIVRLRREVARRRVAV